MSTLRQFTCDDLFRFNGINLDPLTETYGLSFYLKYMARWPEYFMVAESPSGDLMGYIMGKSEGQNENWHGHVTAIMLEQSIGGWVGWWGLQGMEVIFVMAGLANQLMEGLEEISDSKNCYFVDLFVRVSNKIAISFYNKLGYTLYRTVLQYYSGLAG